MFHFHHFKKMCMVPMMGLGSVELRMREELLNANNQLNNK